MSHTVHAIHDQLCACYDCLYSYHGLGIQDQSTATLTNSNGHASKVLSIRMSSFSVKLGQKLPFPRVPCCPTSDNSECPSCGKSYSRLWPSPHTLDYSRIPLALIKDWEHLQFLDSPSSGVPPSYDDFDLRALRKVRLMPKFIRPIGLT